MLHKTEVARFIKIKHSENDEGRCVICIIEVLDCLVTALSLLHSIVVQQVVWQLVLTDQD